MSQNDTINSLISEQIIRLSRFDTHLTHSEAFQYWDTVYESQDEIERACFKMRNDDPTDHNETCLGFALDVWFVSKWYRDTASRCETVTRNEARSLKVQNENLRALISG